MLSWRASSPDWCARAWMLDCPLFVGFPSSRVRSMPAFDATANLSPPSAPAASARLILFVTVFVDLLGFGIVIPLLPMFAGRLGISAFGVGAILAVYSLMQLLCAPVLGR